MTVPASQFRAVLRRHSKSFTLASRLLPPGSRDEAAIVYAWCRRADDAIDRAADETPVAALRRLRRELEAIGRGEAQEEPLLSAFAEVVRVRQIPLQYPRDLLSGMHMDVQGVAYQSLEQLLEYCYRVASTVGLMMCHVLGVRQPAALRPAAHLGLGMQLTNICRDVAEDWQLGRLYLPAELLRRHGVSELPAGGGPFPARAVDACRGVVRELLALADRYYASSRAGLPYLAPRCALSVDVARRVYSAIGRRIAMQRYDVLAGRALVPGREKLLACGAALGAALLRPSVKLDRSLALSAAPAPLPTVSHGPELLRL